MMTRMRRIVIKWVYAWRRRRWTIGRRRIVIVCRCTVEKFVKPFLCNLFMIITISILNRTITSVRILRRAVAPWIIVIPWIIIRIGNVLNAGLRR
jgi:hypothetical protein